MHYTMSLHNFICALGPTSNGNTCIGLLHIKRTFMNVMNSAICLELKLGKSSEYKSCSLL